MRLHLLPLLLSLACGEPQSYPYAIKATAEVPVLEFVRGEATPFESITYTTKVNPSQTGKLVLNSRAKSLKQLMTVPSLRYRVEAKYTLDQPQQLERHFRQTGSDADGAQAFDMLVVISASNALRDMRGKIVPLLTDIISALPEREAMAAGEEEEGVDWRVALVSADASDDRCLVIDTLADLQKLNLDSFIFSDDERVIRKASAALGLEREASACAKFPRNNSHLVVLVTSDKDHQCDMDSPFDGSGKVNARGKQTSYYCGSSLSRFHSELKQNRANEGLKLYALLDSKSSCSDQRADNACYDKDRKQSTSSCKFTNPCYNRASNYKYASANYRRAGIFDLIRYSGEADYSKIVADLKADVGSLFSVAVEEKDKASPFIARLALGAGVIAATVVVEIDDVVLPRKHYRLDKYGVVRLVGDVRKYFPAGSVAVVKYQAKRPYKQVRLLQRQGISALLVHGADSYDFNAKEGLIGFHEALPLKSKIRVSYEYEVKNLGEVAHRANVGDEDVSGLECCLSSDCSSKFSCQLANGLLTHAHDEQVKGGTSFTASYSLTNRVREFSMPHNCVEESLFLKLGDVRCSKLDIVDSSIIKLTSTQAKDNCQVFNSYNDSDDVELHYRFSRQDRYLHLQQVPDAELRIKVNAVPQKPVVDYLITDDGIEFIQALSTDAEVSVSLTP